MATYFINPATGSDGAAGSQSAPLKTITAALDKAQAGDTIQYRLRFAPRSGAGVKNATLDVEHDAANAPSPFTINVTGLAQ